MIRLTLVVAAVLAASLVAGAAPGAADPRSPAASPRLAASPAGVAGQARATDALVRSASAVTSGVLGDLVNRSGPADPRYYAAARWVDGSADCFRCTLGPSVLAAVQAVTTSDRTARMIAVRTFTKAIRTHQRRDGSIGPAGPGEAGRDIQTVMFTNELAVTYLILGHDLPRRNRVLWRNSIKRAASFLIRNGNLTYYVNGNINLAVSMNMDLAARITGKNRFRSAARTALTFTLAPGPRWAGFGLVYTNSPTSADGADGSAYLAESAGGAPGFDASYTMMQADVAAQWFVLTGSPDAERLANLLVNQLLPLVRTTDWTIDVSNGSRHPQSGLRYDFDSSALAVLVAHAGRADLSGLVDGQVRAMWSSFAAATRIVHPGMSFAFGLSLASVQYALAR